MDHSVDCRALGVAGEVGACTCGLEATVARLRTLEEQVLRIAAILNALHNGDDGEMTPGQARRVAIEAICEVLGQPW